MPKPVTDATWATDANFPAGGNPWNGTPTKVAPTAGKQAEGWEPKEKPPAQIENWWKNLVGLWLAWLEAVADAAAAKVWNWRMPLSITVPNAAPGAQNIAFVAADVSKTIRIPLDVTMTKQITAFGINTTAISGGVLGLFTISLHSSSGGAIDSFDVNPNVGGGGIQKHNLAAPHPVVDGDAYWIDVATNVAWNENATIVAVGFEDQFPPA
jgi:hypothetical protein